MKKLIEDQIFCIKTCYYNKKRLMDIIKNNTGEELYKGLLRYENELLEYELPFNDKDNTDWSGIENALREIDPKGMSELDR